MSIVYSWVVSTAAYGYRTPTGTFKPTWMSKMWYSRQYDYAPMPHAVFFHQGVAIHATYATRSLGRPASHGCVRLAPKNAATLFKLVSSHGKERTQIVVHGRPDHSNQVATNDRYERLRRGTAQRYMPASRICAATRLRSASGLRVRWPSARLLLPAATAPLSTARFVQQLFVRLRLLAADAGPIQIRSSRLG